QTAIREPEARVKARRLHDKRVVLPASGGVAVIRSGHLRRIGRSPSIHEDDAPVAVAAPEQDVHTVVVAVLNDSKAALRMKGSRPAVRNAELDRIVFQTCLLAMAIQRFRPWLERRDLRSIAEIGEQTLLVHFDFDANLEERADARLAPVALLARHAVEPHEPVRIARRRPVTRGRGRPLRYSAAQRADLQTGQRHDANHDAHAPELPPYDGPAHSRTTLKPWTTPSTIHAPSMKRRYEPMSRSLPSIEIRRESGAVASMRTLQSAGSRTPEENRTALRPGLIMPLTCSPSHRITITTVSGIPSALIHSPRHVPSRGNPSSENARAAAQMPIKTAQRAPRLIVSPPNCTEAPLRRATPRTRAPGRGLNARPTRCSFTKKCNDVGRLAVVGCFLRRMVVCPQLRGMA